MTKSIYERHLDLVELLAVVRHCAFDIRDDGDAIRRIRDAIKEYDQPEGNLP